MRPFPRQSRAALRAHSRMARSRSALPTSLTEESGIAAAAMLGESRLPKKGYSTPAATGTLAAL